MAKLSGIAGKNKAAKTANTKAGTKTEGRKRRRVRDRKR